MAEEVKLSAFERDLLTDLCECVDGKGIPLPKGHRRVGAALIRKGLAWSVGRGPIAVYIATDAGRAALSTLTPTPAGKL